MITIREIISLCKIGCLKDCRFICDDSSNVSIQVDSNGNPFFDQPTRKDENKNLFDLSEEEIDRIDRENAYYSTKVWDSMQEENSEEMKEPAAFTAEEERKAFLNSICGMISYWNSEGLSNVPKDYNSRQRLEGLVHSILVLIDGGSGTMPKYNISPAPHPDDKDYHISNGEKWHDPDVIINDCQLHDEYNAMGRKPSYERSKEKSE